MTKKFKDLLQAKMFAKSFIQWMYTAVVQSPKGDKANKTLAKNIRDLDASIGYIINDYEGQIKTLEDRVKELEGQLAQK